MNEFLRPLFFICSFALFSILEASFPRRDRIYSRLKRWPSNMFLVVFNNFIIRLIPWVLPIRVASMVQRRGWGLFNSLNLPLWLEFAIAIIVMDLIIYWQHRFLHKIPLLRKVHRLHHIERDLDVTSALKFHPIEIILSMFLKSLSVLILGLTIDQILVFEVILNTMAMFNHMNVMIPVKLDRWIRFLFVTPDMHRVHHSIDSKESNMNFGFNLSLWDYLFKSYLKEAAKAQDEMILGRAGYLEDKYTSFRWQILIPFK